MIEFDGYLHESAEKHFWKKSAKMGQKVFILSLALLSPAVIIPSIISENWWILIFYGLLFIFIPLLTRIPKSKKEKFEMTPKKIVIDEEYIVCTAVKYSESRLIEDVKTIIDYGDFYDINFPFGKVSEKFICQKDLMVKGTIEEFEKIFEGKIQRKS